jgi:hypothetical protein
MVSVSVATTVYVEPVGRRMTIATVDPGVSIAAYVLHEVIVPAKGAA